MSAIDIIKRRLKEERLPDAPWPDEVTDKKKRPREVAFMDVNLCFARQVSLTDARRSLSARHGCVFRPHAGATVAAE